VLFNQVLQRKETWHFDISSALIGAAVAWLIVGIIYSKRREILAFFQKIWAPIKAWRRRARAGQGDKYVKSLQDIIKTKLLFQPDQPDITFIPPTFRVPPLLPKSLAEAAETPPFDEVPFSSLLDGATKLVITGTLGSGRTTTLLMTIWETVKRAEEDQPFERIPVWIDLNLISNLTESDKDNPLERFLQLAILTMPMVSPKWLQQQLRKTPSVILIDNWDVLPLDERGFAAVWIAEVMQELADSYWLIASDVKGYGLLTEIGFVPVQLHHDWTVPNLNQLINGWSESLSVEQELDNEELIKGLRWTSKSDATPLELTLRVVLFLKTQQFPVKPVDTMDFFLELLLPTPELGDELEDLGLQARMTALRIITQIAMIHRMQNRWVSRQEFSEIVKEILPPKEERHKKLEGNVRKLLNNTSLLTEVKKQIVMPHYLWVDFLTAWYLTQQESGPDYVQSHLDHPQWLLLCEFFVGLTDDSTFLVDTLLGNAEIYNDDAALLRTSRWAIVAPENISWKTEVIKTLAKKFMMPAIEPDVRLSYGKYIGLVAGESSRAFFVKMLSTAELEVRTAALRGLGWSGSPKETAILSAALKDSTIEMRKNAILALRDLGTPGSTTILGEYLLNADEELAPIVAQSLASLPQGPGHLQDAVQHPDLLVRRAAVHGLAQINEPWAFEMLEEIIRTDPEWLVRSAAETAVTAIQEAYEKQSVIHPQPNVEEVEWLIRWAARQGTGLGVGEAALAMLIKAAQQGDANTKVLAILTINQVGRQEHLSVLQPLLHDPDELVKAQATDAIQHINNKYQISGTRLQQTTQQTTA
jgi:HEAT repeat protein